MEKRIKALEIEIAYLRKSIEELKEMQKPETHTHYHMDFSNMKPMIINDLKGLKDFTDSLEQPPIY